MWHNSFSHVLLTSPTWFIAAVNSDIYAWPVTRFTFPLLPIGIEVKYWQSSEIKSYRGSFHAMVLRIRMLLCLFDCRIFQQDYGKSKFTIYIFSCITYVYFSKNLKMQELPFTWLEKMRLFWNQGINSAPAKEARLAGLTRAGVTLNVLNRVYGCFFPILIETTQYQQWKLFCSRLSLTK